MTGGGSTINRAAPQQLYSHHATAEVTSQNACHCLKQVAIRRHVWHSPWIQNSKGNTGCLGSLILEMPQASPSDTATRSLPRYFAHILTVKFAPTHLLTILTEHACHHTSFWGSRYDSSHAPTIYLKSGRFRHIFSALTSVFSGHTSSLACDHP